MFETADYDSKLWMGIKGVLETKGYCIKDLKVRRREGHFSFPLSGPWVFIRGIDHRQCGKWALYHQFFDFVPGHCWNKCWKVVIRVKTLADLHSLYSIAVALNFPGKVGINKRSYVKGPYLGFFYSESEGEALLQKEALAQNLDAMNVEYDITHKQMCTEFTASKAVPNPELEHKCDHIFAPIEDENISAAWLKSAVMWEWNNFANAIGDPTAFDRTVKSEPKES
uniref:Uncharacterized protein n=1 Tax=viral metagenome TaxID=1070528 RepID=A0A6M3J165_9ZZZZ